MTKCSDKVYIILVNYNGWRDTIECLESVYKLEDVAYHVVVCDNASSDQSVLHIKAWAEGRLAANICPVGEMTDVSAIPKPLKYQEFLDDDVLKYEEQDADLTILCSKKNSGFAGGCNKGIRYAMAQGDMQYIWLLNNDTVVTTEALASLVHCAELDRNIGMCGSRLMFYDEPKCIQALGGRINKYLGTTSFVTNPKDREKIMYPIGASILVTKKFIKTVGLLSEDYFLYYEEPDWAIRGFKAGYCVECAMDSIVYHHEGATIGIGRKKKSANKMADFYAIRNRILFTKKYYPHFLPTVYMGLFVTCFNRIWRRQYDRIKMVVEIVLKY